MQGALLALSPPQHQVKQTWVKHPLVKELAGFLGLSFAVYCTCSKGTEFYAWPSEFNWFGSLEISKYVISTNELFLFSEIHICFAHA